PQRLTRGEREREHRRVDVDDELRHDLFGYGRQRLEERDGHRRHPATGWWSAGGAPDRGRGLCERDHEPAQLGPRLRGPGAERSAHKVVNAQLRPKDRFPRADEGTVPLGATVSVISGDNGHFHTLTMRSGTTQVFTTGVLAYGALSAPATLGTGNYSLIDTV